MNSQLRGLLKSKSSSQLASQLSMDEDSKMACGKDTNLDCQGLIGAGGYGKVYKMVLKDKKPFRLGTQGHTSSKERLFARKLVRLDFWLHVEDIENQIKALESLYRKGGHQHIIEVIKHGWLPGMITKCYFIDMELADLSLAEYIAYVFHEKPLPSSVWFGANFDPVFSSKHCTEPQRLQTVFTIMFHIAKGVEFIHQTGYVHRDLKPANVLYCGRAKLWKLTDFDITSTGLSKAKTTGYARGTHGYRSPELLNYDEPRYNNRSDIWALGCVLHELATGHLVFKHDNLTTMYYDNDPLPELPIRLSYTSNFWRNQISYSLRHFLSKEPHERPNATVVSRRLAAYCMLLELPGMELLADSSLPPYFEWENVMTSGLSIVELLLELGKWYLRNGDNEVGGSLMETILYSLNQMEVSDILSDLDMSQTPQSEKRTGPGGFWVENVALLRDIGERLLRKQEGGVATLIFKGLAQNVPKSVHTSLIAAANDGDIFSIEMLLKDGESEVNISDSEGCTSLHRAAYNGHEKAVEILLHHKADVDKQDHAGKTALAAAARNGHENVVNILLQYDAAIDQQDFKGWTPLHRAAMKGHEKVVEMLLQHKATVDHQEFKGWTALHWAAVNGHDGVVEILLQHKANVDMQEGMHLTALHLAAQKGHQKVIEILLLHNADIRKRAVSRETALDSAELHGHKNIADLLRQYKSGTWTPAGREPSLAA